jgi:hypothetical protein
MKTGTAKFLQTLVVLIGLAALTFLLVEPHFEGRNVNATVFEVYFKDPFLAYVYFGSIPFFAALYHAYKALGLAGRGEARSPETARALRIVKRCAWTFFDVVVVALFIIAWNDSDDRAGGMAIGLVVAAGAAATAVVAAKLERKIAASSQPN